MGDTGRDGKLKIGLKVMMLLISLLYFLTIMKINLFGYQFSALPPTALTRASECVNALLIRSTGTIFSGSPVSS
jgi:hypothetical protein